MPNSLEKYIQEHRHELDVFVPSPGVWEGINARMHNNPTFIKSHASWLKYFGFSASIIAVLVYLKVNSSTDVLPAAPQKEPAPVVMSKAEELAQKNIPPPTQNSAPSEPISAVGPVAEKKLSEPVAEKPVVDAVMPAAGKDSTMAEPIVASQNKEQETKTQTNQTNMKSTALKTALLFSALAFDTMAVVHAQDSTTCTKQKNTITQERTVSPFTELSVSGVGDIFISQGDKEQVSVVAPEKYQSMIEVVNEGNMLVIRQKKESKLSGDISINITIKDISRLNVSGIGKIKTKTPLNLNELYCKISAMGNLNLELNCKKFKAEISSIGNVTMKGHADEADVQLSGMGNFKALDFEVGKLTAKMNGMGNAEVNATESIDINASGMGNLKYKGNPPHEVIKASGMGNVSKI